MGLIHGAASNLLIVEIHRDRCTAGSPAITSLFPGTEKTSESRIYERSQAARKYWFPCIQRRDAIREALDSILAQTFEDFELIIVDNASTDTTPEICQEYAARKSGTEE